MLKYMVGARSGPWPDPVPPRPLPGIAQSFPGPPLPTRKFSASYHVVGLDFYFGGFGPLLRPLDFFHKTHPQVVIPMPSATHMQIFSLLACRWAGFLFLGFWPLARPLDFFRQTHPQVVIPMPSATHMQIFSLLACRSVGFLFWPPGPPPWLFSQNAPTGRHSHAISYPHANFQHPSMSFGWIFILGVLAPWPAPLTFFKKFFLIPVLRIPSATHMQIFSLLACRRDTMSVIKRSSAPPAPFTFDMDLRLICA